MNKEVGKQIGLNKYVGKGVGEFLREQKYLKGFC